MTGAGGRLEGWPGRGFEGLVAELRDVGVPVAVSEQVDAVRSLAQLESSESESAKSAVRAALVKDRRHEAVFDVVYDLHFGASLATEQGEGVLSSLADADLQQLLVQVLSGGGPSSSLQAVVREAVDRYAGVEPGRPVAGNTYVFRTIRALGGPELAEVLAARMPGFARADPLGRRLLRDRAGRSFDVLRQEVESEIRRRLVADRGAHAVARTLRTPLPDDVEFLTASAERIAEMQQVIAPIARRLESRLAGKQRARRRGAVDFRRTMRRSLSLGGVPVVPALRRPRPVRPNVVVLADISASVATFAGFALQLVYALRSQFSDLRTFVFVDGLADVSELLATSPDIRAAARRMNTEASGVWLDSSSDYGNALHQFWTSHAGGLSWRSVVLVLGDARGNYRAPRLDVARAISRRVGGLYWLNPEPRALWGTGDSVMGEYAAHCDGAFECRSLRGLRDFVAGLD